MLPASFVSQRLKSSESTVHYEKPTSYSLKQTGCALRCFLIAYIAENNFGLKLMITAVTREKL